MSGALRVMIDARMLLGRFSGDFFGPSYTNIKKVAFLIDASGSLIDTLPFVIMELKKSIHSLHPKQTLGIFQKTLNFSLKMATNEAKWELILDSSSD